MSVINTNISSLTAQRNLGLNQAALSTSMQRLSSGLRINSAKDDAAGLAISERMTSQIRGSNQAARNANDGISLAQTAEGDLAQIGSNLQRMRELAVQSANATNSTSDRAALDGEVQALSKEIDRTAQNSGFNGNKLLDGTFTAQDFQVGANNTANDRITVASIASSRTADLGTTFTATKTSGVPTTVLTAGDLTLQVGSNIFSVGVPVDAGAGQTADSAKQIAAAINATSSGVTATANTTTAVAGAIVGTTTGNSGTLTINGSAITLNATTGSPATDGANMALQISNSSSVTGVTAAYDGGTGKITMTAIDGRNIVVGAYTGSISAADTGITASTSNKSTFALSSSSSFTVGGNAPAKAGLVPETVATVAGGTALANISITSVSGAKAAIDTIDSALKSVNSSRASIGAIQNRFTSVVTSLQTTSENLSASRSRIQDADFAAETANLSRAQVLQQAGTAMVAQANQLPQGVLSLLR
jgi:flagellin